MIKNQQSDTCETVCDQTVIHKEIIQKVRESMTEDDSLNEMAELFKVLGDRTRIRILYALYQSEMCVCDLASLLEMTQSAISHQLRVLKQAKLVKNRKEGKVVYYSPADLHVMQIFMQAMDHVKE
ncbi:MULTISPECIES: ArsR/SmtB family transcription factor [Heyndrickxia]|uniref:ArsR family transcriptional regulator n=1 Tax=Heyndrickxia ginsengihumi TaxID=363870 RepID=A0A0A6VGE2_9BACI|nr:MULTISPECIES: metalloregulator ArsR/SmtB family transcription factor [Heyndrickxia]MBE6184795.1 winged helix-turn-helix transcriptional regulator [Bacillus sp. (in: firmicutes)]KHD86651.1 ArsR family transcriptional regulator [Heyndrickxia ginsengihumi]MCM3022693.1 metalloregulator ArsR/SmtB family transcription factor [Heyndrickxia ginsengihumi]NEY18969.1 winged helix-turn-helix transcriptional regulator [Heyndrickxia ginsengihumi]UZH05558.1 metalloregulator ArsR/SmtB family transcription 